MILYTKLIKSFKFGSVDFYKVNSYFDICFLKTLETGCWSVLLQWLTFGVTSHMQLLFSAYVDRYDILVKNLSWIFSNLTFFDCLRDVKNKTFNLNFCNGEFGFIEVFKWKVTVLIKYDINCLKCSLVGSLNFVFRS